MHALNLATQCVKKEKNTLSWKTREINFQCNQLISRNFLKKRGHFCNFHSVSQSFSFSNLGVCEFFVNSNSQTHKMCKLLYNQPWHQFFTLSLLLSKQPHRTRKRGQKSYKNSQFFNVKKKKLPSLDVVTRFRIFPDQRAVHVRDGPVLGTSVEPAT